MPAVSTTGITELLDAWSSGDKSALEKLVPLIVQDLRQIAKRHLDRERRGHTLQTTALVNEIYLRLVDMKKVNWKSRAHFFAASSQWFAIFWWTRPALATLTNGADMWSRSRWMKPLWPRISAAWTWWPWTMP